MSILPKAYSAFDDTDKRAPPSRHDVTFQVVIVPTKAINPCNQLITSGAFEVSTAIFTLRAAFSKCTDLASTKLGS